MFYQLAGYPLARLDGHIKFTIPVSVGRVGEEEEVRRHWVGQGGGGLRKGSHASSSSLAGGQEQGKIRVQLASFGGQGPSAEPSVIPS